MLYEVKKIRIRKRHCGLNPYIANLKCCGEYGWGESRAKAKSKLISQLFDHGNECLCDKNKCYFYNDKFTANCTKGKTSRQADLCMSNEYRFYKAAQDVRQ